MLDEQPRCGVVDGLPGHGPSGIHHREYLLGFFVLCFATVRVGNFSANNGTFREEGLGWPFPSVNWARKKQLLNKWTDASSLSRTNVYFY